MKYFFDLFVKLKVFKLFMKIQKFPFNGELVFGDDDAGLIFTDSMPKVAAGPSAENCTGKLQGKDIHR